MRLPSRILLALIRSYQAFSAGTLPRCRFLPTCSAYAAEAIGTHGAARGTWYAVRRLAKCRPLGPFGHDPVPSPRDLSQKSSLEGDARMVKCQPPLGRPTPFRRI